MGKVFLEESVQQTEPVSRGTRILVAVTIVAWGLAAAFVFQRATPMQDSSDASRPERFVSRGEAAWATNEAPAPPLPVVRLRTSASPPPLTSADPMSITSPAVTLNAMDAGSPPPKLARSFPEASVPIASQWGAMLGLAPANRGSTARPGKTHQVVDGDTLKLLARRYLGTPDRFMEIYAANRDVLPNPEVLPIGAELKIPQTPQVSPALTPDSPPASSTIRQDDQPR